MFSKIVLMWGSRPVPKIRYCFCNNKDYMPQAATDTTLSSRPPLWTLWSHSTSVSKLLKRLLVLPPVIDLIRDSALPKKTKCWTAKELQILWSRETLVVTLPLCCRHNWSVCIWVQIIVVYDLNYLEYYKETCVPWINPGNSHHVFSIENNRRWQFLNWGGFIDQVSRNSLSSKVKQRMGWKLWGSPSAVSRKWLFW